MHMVMKYAEKLEIKERHVLMFEVLKVIENEMQEEEGT